MTSSSSENFFLVESPLQLLCATEARERFGDGVLIIKETGSEKNNQQLQDLVKRFEWRQVYTFTRGDSRRFASIKLLLLVSKLVRPSEQSKIFLGDYRSRWMQLASNRALSQSYMLDDGLAMLETVDNLRENKALVGQSFFNRIMSELLGLGHVKNKPIHAFSFLPISPAGSDVTVVSHRFEMLRRKLKGVAQTDAKTACFIGSRYVENGIIDQTDYTALLKEAMRLCESQGRKLIYLPHRYESEEGLDTVRQLGIEIQMLNYPVELAYLMGEIRFGLVIGLYSTALISLGLLIDSLDTCSFRPENSVFKSRQAGIFKCYDLMERLSYIETRKVSDGD